MYVDGLWFYWNVCVFVGVCGWLMQGISYSSEDSFIQTKIFIDALETIDSW